MDLTYEAMTEVEHDTVFIVIQECSREPGVNVRIAFERGCDHDYLATVVNDIPVAFRDYIEQIADDQ